MSVVLIKVGVVAAIVIYGWLSLAPELATLRRRRRMVDALASVGVDPSVAGMIVWHHDSPIADGIDGVCRYMKNISAEKASAIAQIETDDDDILCLCHQIERAWRMERGDLA